MNEHTKKLIDKKTKLEEDITTLIVSFYEDTSLWVDHIKVCKETNKNIGDFLNTKPYVVDYWVQCNIIL